MLGRLRARLGYFTARKLMKSHRAVQQPKLWRWMEGQFARMAAQGDVEAQCFYGHILYFRGLGHGAKREGVRLLRLAATAGDVKAAYQMGVISLSEAGHPLAAVRLEQLYRAGGHGLVADTRQADRYKEKAAQLGL